MEMRAPGLNAASAKMVSDAIIRDPRLVEDLRVLTDWGTTPVAEFSFALDPAGAPKRGQSRYVGLPRAAIRQ